MSAGCSNEPRVVKTNNRPMANWAGPWDWTLDLASDEAVPVSVHIRGLVLQKDDLPRVMATHFSISIVDDAECIISAK